MEYSKPSPHTASTGRRGSGFGNRRLSGLAFFQLNTAIDAVRLQEVQTVRRVTQGKRINGEKNNLSFIVGPSETPDESESLNITREWLANPLTFPELPERLFEPGSLGRMPLVVLSMPQQQRPKDLPAAFRDALDEIWVDLQKEWAHFDAQHPHLCL